MSIVSVPIINATLVNPRLLDLRIKFIQNDVELLRRQFEVYGVELSTDMINLYVKTLILYNANVVWDMAAVTFRKSYQQTYTNSTHKMIFDAPFSVSLAKGVKSIDPITLSFISFDEAKKLIEAHVRTIGKGYSTTTSIFDVFDIRGYVERERDIQAKYGAFNLNYIPYNTQTPSTPTSNAPLSNTMNNSESLWYQQKATNTSNLFQGLFSNPNLDMKSLIPAFTTMFQQNPYQTTGIPYKPYYDFQTLHFASIDYYLAVFRYKDTQDMAYVSTVPRYSDPRKILRDMPLLGQYYSYATYLSNGQTVILGVQPETTIPYVASSEIPTLSSSYPYPSTDTRSDYQKVFTNSSYTPDQVSTQLNQDKTALLARRTKLNKEFIDARGGHPSIFVALIRLIAEAHASVMTPINIHYKEFYQSFTRVLAICDLMYDYGNGNYSTSPSMQEYMPTGGSRIIYGVATNVVRQLYVFLNDNFRVETFTTNKTYTGGKGDPVPAWTGYKEIVKTSNGIFSVKVTVPVDPAQSYPYYMVDPSVGLPTHLVKSPALLGIQRLRNGFLYQDIERNWEPTFVNFNQDVIGQLENIVTKQMAMYDLLDDVKLGNIYTKTVSQQVPVQPFNPSQPQYTTQTTSFDMLKTSEGEVPLIHPEEEFAIKWQALHAEFVLLSSFYHANFAQGVKPVIDDYNNRVAIVINKILTDMATLSASYSALEAQKLASEQEQTALEVKLAKLKSGIFIDDNGREYWRPLLPEEQDAVDKMIAQVQTNIATIEQNKVNEEQNKMLQAQADEARIKENEQAQAKADADALAQNIYLQNKANQDWLNENVLNIPAPTIQIISKYSDDADCTLTQSLEDWMNHYPYWIYNQSVAPQVEALRLKIKEAEEKSAEALVAAKINEIEITKAFKELFTIIGK